MMKKTIFSFNFLRYASLYFCVAIEKDDNELLTLEIIHRYVELLDKYFGSVSTQHGQTFLIVTAKGLQS